MTPLFRLAWRESRFARRRLLLFLSSISLGVGALVATQSFAAGMSQSVRDQSRGLLGADVAMEANRPFGEKTEAFLAGLKRGGTPVARATTFASMALADGGATRLVQVRAVEPGYPYYGEIVTDPAGEWARMHRGRNVLVDPAVLVALDVRVGDSLALGEARFRIAGSLLKVPGEVGIGTLLAPRVYIPAARLEETELVRFGSRAEYEAFIRLPDAESARLLVEAHRPALRAERVGMRTAEEQQRSLDRALGRLASYLGLVGTFALLLGGIGVASAMGAYMAQKRETVATLRCLGATAPQVVAIYAAQAGVMGLAGATLGAALGAATQWVLPRLLSSFLPVQVATGVSPAAVGTGIAVGVWIALAFALLPILATRRVSPLEALRRRLDGAPVPAARRDVWVWAARLLLAASVVGLVAMQAGDREVGLGFSAGVGVTLLLLWACAWLVVHGLRRAGTAGLPFTARQGVANLHRPGNQTRTVVLSLGFGVFLLATLYLVQDNLLRPLRPGAEGARANLVLFDVQEDQEAGASQVLSAAGVEVLQRAPIVPMRVAEVNGKPVARIAPRPDSASADTAAAEGTPGSPGGDDPAGGREGQPRGWAVRREYRSTFRDTVVASEKVLQGKMWTPGGGMGADGVGEVSLEEGIAVDLGVKLGDRITWDVQGVPIPTRVTSIREVDWRRLEPNFFAVFPTEVLSGAPQTWVILGRTPSADVRARVQRDVVSRYSNIAAVDLTQVQAAVDDVLGRVALVIRFLAAFSVATGIVVLLGAILTARLQRVRESVLLRTLGATQRQVRAILLAEYLALGTAAGLSGVLFAVGAGWALARWLFEMDFAVPFGPLAMLVAGNALLCALVGLWASGEVFRLTPLEMLREE